MDKSISVRSDGRDIKLGQSYDATMNAESNRGQKTDRPAVRIRLDPGRISVYCYMCHAAWLGAFLFSPQSHFRTYINWTFFFSWIPLLDDLSASCPFTPGLL